MRCYTQDMTFPDINFLDHLGFLVIALYLGLVGQVIKGIVLGTTAASTLKNKAPDAQPRPLVNPETGKGTWRWWYLKTLPLHAPLVATIFGCFPFAPCPLEVCSTTTHRILYYTASGILSSYLYDAMRHFAQKKISEFGGPSKDPEGVGETDADSGVDGEERSD